MNVPKGRITLQTFEELQVCLGAQPLVLALRDETSAEIFGEVLLPGQTYTVLPHSFFSITTLTKADLDVLGDPVFADVTSSNSQTTIQTLNLATSLNRLRFKAFKQHDGVNLMIVGAPRSGKSSLTHTLVKYSERSGWRPLIYNLDPSGTSPFVYAAAAQGPGVITAHVGDRKDDPSTLLALIDKAETSANKLDVLREWVSAKQDKRGGGNPSDIRNKVAGLIGNLARREAVGLSTDDPETREFAAKTSASDMSASTLISSYSWERLLRPLDDQNEDTVAVWSGLNPTTDQKMFIRACQELREIARTRLITTDLLRASGSILDCPSGLSADTIVSLATAFEVEVIICIGDTELNSLLSEKTKCEVFYWSPFQSKCPQELLHQMLSHQAIRVTHPVEKVVFPKLRPSDPAQFIKDCTRSPPIPFCGIPAPIPARLLFTPVTLHLKTSQSLSPNVLRLVRVRADDTLEEVGLSNIPTNTFVPVAIGRSLVRQVSASAWLRRDMEKVELLSVGDNEQPVRVFLGHSIKNGDLVVV